MLVLVLQDSNTLWLSFMTTYIPFNSCLSAEACFCFYMTSVNTFINTHIHTYTYTYTYKYTHTNTFFQRFQKIPMMIYETYAVTKKQKRGKTIIYLLANRYCNETRYPLSATVCFLSLPSATTTLHIICKTCHLDTSQYR